MLDYLIPYPLSYPMLSICEASPLSFFIYHLGCCIARLAKIMNGIGSAFKNQGSREKNISIGSGDQKFQCKDLSIRDKRRLQNLELECAFLSVEPILALFFFLKDIVICIIDFI